MQTLFLIGRVLLGGYFIFNAYNHFKNLGAMTGYAAMKGVPYPKVAVIITGVMLAFGGLSIVLGMFAIEGIAVLILFLVPTTFMMHKFWKETDMQARMVEQVNFAKNIALIGALIIIGLLFFVTFI